MRNERLLQPVTVTNHAADNSQRDTISIGPPTRTRTRHIQRVNPIFLHEPDPPPPLLSSSAHPPKRTASSPTHTNSAFLRTTLPRRRWSFDLQACLGVRAVFPQTGYLRENCARVAILRSQIGQLLRTGRVFHPSIGVYNLRAEIGVCHRLNAGDRWPQRRGNLILPGSARRACECKGTHASHEVSTIYAHRCSNSEGGIRRRHRHVAERGEQSLNPQAHLRVKGGATCEAARQARRFQHA
jgi:hypothetical protein